MVEAWQAAAREYAILERRHGRVDLADRDATRQLRHRLDESEQIRRGAGPDSPWDGSSRSRGVAIDSFEWKFTCGDLHRP